MDGYVEYEQALAALDWSTLAVPSEPTDALPGTPEKVAVMMRRHRDGERLHHPSDPVIDWTPRGDEDEESVDHVEYRRQGRGRKQRKSNGRRVA